MPVLDRALQRIILEELREQYPQSTELFTALPGTEESRVANLCYLAEHGLCESGIILSADGFISTSEARITARGLDFLEDDGGLAAILDTVTIKLHADTVRDLIAVKIERAALPEPEKSALRRHLTSLPGAALQAATTELVKSGLDHLPDAIPWLRTLVGL
ncbi:MAG TPA: hypothetical protein VH020_09245 [Stellaceae bacterium]|jgi:hypothetical protein|nr:hypothetical protein [Stellaceae bacterium]